MSSHANEISTNTASVMAVEVEAAVPELNADPIAASSSMSQALNLPIATSRSNESKSATSSAQFSPSTTKILENYQQLASQAASKNCIFTIIGRYNIIRDALLARGWLQKFTSAQHAELQSLPMDELLAQAQAGSPHEQVAISLCMSSLPANFIWQPKYQADEYANVYPYRNRIRHSNFYDFTTKVGLIGCAEQHWYDDLTAARMNCPRFYRLHGTWDERLSFMEDFYRTQCISLLRYVCGFTSNPRALADENIGTAELSCLEYAITQMTYMLPTLETHSIRNRAAKRKTVEEQQQWKEFIQTSNEIMQGRAIFRATFKDVRLLQFSANRLLSRIDVQRPDLKWDGQCNLWIVKPGSLWRGRGIVTKNNMTDILQFVDRNRKQQYIAQKYIERPLLIYKTKFDIRQHVLMTVEAHDLNIWLYTDCYLRFSSQEFNLENLDNAVHLTNHSIQQNCTNQMGRDERLPANNMWSLEQFQLYLQEQNAPPDTWQRIFNGFCDNVIAVALASFDGTSFVKNSFEIYGVDFMLDESYKPILIEVNCTPDLSPSTEVTKRICRQVQDDLVKVVVDLPLDAKADVGAFKKVCVFDYELKEIRQVNKL